MKKPKMRSMAENYEKLEVAPSSQQPYYPSFRVSEKQLPQAAEWEVGKTYSVCMEVKMVGMESRNNRPPEFQFEMRKIGAEAEEE